MITSRLSPRWLIVLASTWILIQSDGLLAASRSYEVKGQITSSSFPSEIAVGDSFTHTFVLSDTITDDIPGNSFRFSAIMSEFSFFLSAGATGTYPGGNPTGGNSSIISGGDDRTVPPFSPFDVISIDSPLVFTMANSLPQLEGKTVAAVRLELSTNLGDTNTSLNDTGTGQTFSELFGNPNLSDWTSQKEMKIIISGSSDSVIGSISSFEDITVVPEPHFYVSATAFCLLILCIARRRNRQTVPSTY